MQKLLIRSVFLVLLLSAAESSSVAVSAETYFAMKFGLSCVKVRLRLFASTKRNPEGLWGKNNDPHHPSRIQKPVFVLKDRS